MIPDNGFLDRLYEVYKNPDPQLGYRLNKVEYLMPSYEKIKAALGRRSNSFRSVEILEEDSPENYLGEKGPVTKSSLEERPVYEIRYGKKTGASVLVYSQMHGTESTGTRALLDIFEFLLGEEDFKLKVDDRNMAKSLRKAISSLNIHFIPMINPDGANNWQRCTMQNMSEKHPYLFVSGKNSSPGEVRDKIDLNRDAWTTESREAKLLWRAFANFDRSEDEQQPIFAFNLHDQGSTGVGAYDTPASITMLSPAANGAKYFNDPRYRATQIIQKMDMEQVQAELPNMTSRYSDDWGPVYFGDSFSMVGIGVILIESGQVKLDPEKRTLRRTNFKAILRGLWEMAGDYKKIDPVDWTPPKNFLKKANTANVIPKPPSRRVIYDVLLRNVEAPNGSEYNLGINRQLNVISFEGKDAGAPPEHRSLWYYTSGFSGQGEGHIFHDNLTVNSARLEAGAKPAIPYLTFNNGSGESRYSNPGSTRKPNPLRYWGDIGYPSNFGMTFDTVWPEKNVSFGYEELECGKKDGNLKIVQARAGGKDPATGKIVFESPGSPAPAYKNIDSISLGEAWELLRAGVIAVRLSAAPESEYYNLPLIVLIGNDTRPPTISDDAGSGFNNFILADRKSGKAKYALIGGYLIDLGKDPAYPVWGIRDGKQCALPLAGYEGDKGMYADSYEGHFRNRVIK